MHSKTGSGRFFLFWFWSCNKTFWFSKNVEPQDVYVVVWIFPPKFKLRLHRYYVEGVRARAVTLWELIILCTVSNEIGYAFQHVLILHKAVKQKILLRKFLYLVRDEQGTSGNNINLMECWFVTCFCWASFCDYRLYEIGPWSVELLEHSMIRLIRMFWGSNGFRALCQRKHSSKPKTYPTFEMLP